jgi:catechol 2,3-dioxygenase-like lactoylglutathione lyase family enzyme
MKIFITSVFVDDQEKALKFYTEVLGFVKKEDVSAGAYRWLTVVSADSLGVPSTIIDVMSVEQLLTEVAQGAEVVTQRFHGALAGLAVGIPVIIGSQAPGDKLSTLDALIKAGSAKERLLDLIGSGERSLRSVLQKS